MLHEVCNANLEDHRGMISALGNVEKRQKKRKYQLVFPFFFIDYLLQLCSRPFYNHQLGVFIDAASHNISTKMDIETGERNIWYPIDKLWIDRQLFPTVEKLKNGNEMTSTHHEIKNCTDFILRRIFDSKNDNERPSKMSPKREHFDCDLIGSDSAGKRPWLLLCLTAVF